MRRTPRGRVLCRHFLSREYLSAAACSAPSTPGARKPRTAKGNQGQPISSIETSQVARPPPRERPDGAGLPWRVPQRHPTARREQRGNAATMFCCGGKAEPAPERMYGAELTLMGDEDKTDDGIPRLVDEAIKYLRAKGLETQGIFRRSANATKLRQCKELYNSGEKVDFDSLGGVHLTANALKSFFRDLRQPLLTCSMFSDVMKMQKEDFADEADKVKKAKTLMVEHLPGIHLTILRTILRFMANVCENSDKNGMTTSNMAIVFGPNFLWPKGSGPNSGKVAVLDHVKAQGNFLEFLINNRDELFANVNKDGYKEVEL